LIDQTFIISRTSRVVMKYHNTLNSTVFKIEQNSLCNCELKTLVSDAFMMWLKKTFIFRELGYITYQKKLC